MAKNVDISHREADITINHIKALYLETKGSGLPTEEEILERQVTQHFWLGIVKGIENGELINIAIRGKTGSSKSTVGCKILYVIIMKMIKEGKIKKPKDDKEMNEYLYSRICSDQTEFLRFAMHEKGNTVSLIDEFSTMGETGFNATIEKSMYQEHSDLFAQENINKISCSPSYINDRNADIILDVVGIDRENKITQLKLNYRSQTEWIIYPLGVVNIYVGDILEMPFYKRYREKKFKRLDLLKKHGIRNVRELEFARITLGTYKKMNEIARIKKQGQDIIISLIGCVAREQKMQYSILTLNFLSMKVKALLDIETEIALLKRKYYKLKVEEEKNVVKEAISEYRKLLNEQLNEEINKIKVESEYRNIT